MFQGYLLEMVVLESFLTLWCIFNFDAAFTIQTVLIWTLIKKSLCCFAMKYICLTYVCICQSSLAEDRIIKGAERRGRSKRMIDLVWENKKRTGAGLTSHVLHILDNQLLARLFLPPFLFWLFLCVLDFFSHPAPPCRPHITSLSVWKAEPGHWKASSSFLN